MKVLTDNIQEVCNLLAHRMRKVDELIAISQIREKQVSLFQASFWRPLTLGHGYPSLICLFTEMQHFFPNECWVESIDTCIRAMVKEIETNGIQDASLFNGATGICLAVDLAIKGGGKYLRLHHSLHTWLLEKIKIDYLNPLSKLIQDRQPLPPNLYDLISGITGMIPYLLLHLDKANTKEIVIKLLEVLVFLTNSLQTDYGLMPGWYIAPKDLYNLQIDSSKQQGCLDTGMAHGIAGCLTVLSKALLAGIIVNNHIEAIKTIITWLQAQCKNVGTCKNVWPGRFGVQFSNHQHMEEGYRDGWCYGAPGIAFSLFIAACALKDASLYEYAKDAMIAVCHRYRTANTLSCPTFCHGLAGLMTMVHQMSLATKHPLFSEVVEEVCQQILGLYREEYPLGFKCQTPTRDLKFAYVDNGGILDGTAGVLLSLLFLQSNGSRPWMEIFLLV